MEAPNHIRSLKPNNIQKNLQYTHLNLNEWNFNHPASCDNILSTYSYESKTHDVLLDSISKYIGLQKSYIQLVNGGDNAIRLVIDTFATHNSESLILVPTYDYYKRYCMIKNIKTHDISIGIDEKITGHFFNFYNSLLSNSSTENRVIVFICHPNNPTGYLFDKHELVKLLSQYPNVVFVVDESYVDFYVLANDDISFDHLCAMHGNLFVIRTFSKAFGLAGGRLAYIVTNPNNITNLDNVCNCKDVTEFIKTKALNIMNVVNYYAETNDIMLQNKSRVVQVLRDNKIEFLLCGKTNFITLLLPYQHNFLEYCDAHKLSIRNLNDRNNLSNCVRISIGNDSDTEKTINLINEYCKQTPSSNMILQKYLTDKEKISHLKNLMIKSHEILILYNINYWAECGTLLGILRHGGIISWDNDIDIGIMQKDIDRLTALKTVFEKNKITLRASRLKNYLVLEDMTTHAYIDVFPFVDVDSKFVNIDERFRLPDGSKNANFYYLNIDEIFPLKQGSFYGKLINIPNKASLVVERSIPNFMNTCVINDFKFSLQENGFA